MEIIKDKLVTSPVCGGNACYESEFMTEDTSNTTMTLDSEALKQTLELTADLIKDLRLDLVPPGGGEKLAWFPTVISMPEKGMIFPEPQEWASATIGLKEDSLNNKKEWTTWGWTVVKAIDIPKEEQEKYPDPRNPGEFYKKRMDMKKPKRFQKMEFMDAAEELGMFKKDFINEQGKDNKSKTNS